MRAFKVKCFIVSFCAVLSALSVPAYASASQTRYMKCSVCGEYSYFDLDNEYPPTCTSWGDALYICRVCGHEYHMSKSSLGHDFQETSRIEPAFCASGISYQQCSRCAETRSEILPALAEDHAWMESSRIDATCTESGFISYECSVCYESKTEPIPALDHDWTETGRAPATCTDAGYIRRACSRCGFSTMEEIPPLGSGHSWTETNRRDSTEISSGLIEYICSTCGASRSEILPALSSGGSMSEMLAKISVVLSASMNWVSIVAEKVANNPIFLIMVILSFLGTGVLLFRRLLNL